MTSNSKQNRQKHRTQADKKTSFIKEYNRY